MSRKLISYEFTPQPDISAFELSQIMYNFLGYSIPFTSIFLDQEQEEALLTSTLSRHFTRSSG